LDLDADEHQISFPSSTPAPARLGVDRPEGEAKDLTELSRRSSPSSRRRLRRGAPLQALVCNLDASRMSDGSPVRIMSGPWSAPDRRCAGSTDHRERQAHEMYITQALERVPAQSAGPGDIVAIAGIAEIRSARRWPTLPTPSRCPRCTSTAQPLDDHRINTSPMAGRRARADAAWSRTARPGAGRQRLAAREPTERPTRGGARPASCSSRS